MTGKDAQDQLEDLMEAARPGTKRMLVRLRSVSKELRVAVFSLNAGAALALSGIYASLPSESPAIGTPYWLVTAVTIFALGALIFLGSLALDAAILQKRIWSDPSGRFDKALSCLGHIVLYSPRGEGTCLVVGAISVMFGFLGKLL
jgi:hypothetical protein